MRLELLMRRMALDWALSRRQTEMVPKSPNFKMVQPVYRLDWVRI